MGAFHTKVDSYIVVSSKYACAYEICQEEGNMLHLTGLDKTDLLQICEKTILEGLACDVSIANKTRRCVVFIHKKKIMAIPFKSLNGKQLVTVMAEHDEHLVHLHQHSTVHTLSNAFDASEPSMSSMSSKSLGSLTAQMKQAINKSQGIKDMVSDIFAECFDVNSPSTSSSTATAVAPSDTAMAPSAVAPSVAPSTAHSETRSAAPSTAIDEVAPSATTAVAPYAATAVAPSATTDEAVPSAAELAAALASARSAELSNYKDMLRMFHEKGPSVAKLRMFYEQAPIIAKKYDLTYTFGNDHLFVARAVPTNQNWRCMGECGDTLAFGKYCSCCDSYGYATPLQHQYCNFGENCTKLTTCTYVHSLTPDQFFKALQNAKISVEDL